METQKKNRKNLQILRENWAVAELEVSYQVNEHSGVFIKSSPDTYEVLKNLWDLKLISLQEHCYVLFLSPICEVIGWRLINTGNIGHIALDVKFIISLSLKCMADAIIICHNHPSGRLEPTESDKASISDLAAACKLFNIRLLDSMIISDQGYFSWMDNDIPLDSEKDLQYQTSVNQSQVNSFDKEYNSESISVLNKLMEFFSPKELPDLVKYYKRVFELAFLTENEITGFDKTCLYFHYQLIGLIEDIQQQKFVQA